MRCYKWGKNSNQDLEGVLEFHLAAAFKENARTRMADIKNIQKVGSMDIESTDVTHSPGA